MWVSVYTCLVCSTWERFWETSIVTWTVLIRVGFFQMNSKSPKGSYTSLYLKVHLRKSLTTTYVAVKISQNKICKIKNIFFESVIKNNSFMLSVYLWIPMLNTNCHTSNANVHRGPCINHVDNWGWVAQMSTLLHKCYFVKLSTRRRGESKIPVVCTRPLVLCSL